MIYTRYGRGLVADPLGCASGYCFTRCLLFVVAFVGAAVGR